jgi:catechol 2,3-dioxygenase-like lactoylglutathione lyase family enzyme
MAKLVGINHVALEVDDVEEALEWYERFFELGFSERHAGMAFVDLGDQFLAFAGGRTQPADESRHFGLVVDDKEGVRRALADAGIAVSAHGSLDFRDPWGNLVQVVDYRDIQFSKTPEVLKAMGLELEKSEQALGELRAKGIEPSATLRP